MLENIKKISKKLKSRFYFDYDIYQFTWFQTGGKADLYCLVEDKKELEIILNNLSDEIPLFILGAGSNVLIRDGGFKGIVIKLGKSFNSLTLQENCIEVGSSVLDINLSKFAFNNSLTGLEFYSGIPGTIGGAIKMNAGCFGYETKNFVKEISVITKKGINKILNNNDIGLEYRNSNISDNDIVTSVVYQLKEGDKNLINFNINKIKDSRKNSQPLKTKTGGSTFKNPKDLFAAKLIEESNCKGISVGDAIVSNIHSNFLINAGNATANEIETLGKIIREKVQKKFNILLEWEIKIIGEDSE